MLLQHKKKSAKLLRLFLRDINHFHFLLLATGILHYIQRMPLSMYVSSGITIPKIAFKAFLKLILWNFSPLLPPIPTELI